MCALPPIAGQNQRPASGSTTRNLPVSHSLSDEDISFPIMTKHTQSPQTLRPTDALSLVRNPRTTPLSPLARSIATQDVSALNPLAMPSPRAPVPTPYKVILRQTRSGACVKITVPLPKLNMPLKERQAPICCACGMELKACTCDRTGTWKGSSL